MGAQLQPACPCCKACAVYGRARSLMGGGRCGCAESCRRIMVAAGGAGGGWLSSPHPDAHAEACVSYHVHWTGAAHASHVPGDAPARLALCSVLGQACLIVDLASRRALASSATAIRSMSWGHDKLQRVYDWHSLGRPHRKPLLQSSMASVQAVQLQLHSLLLHPPSREPHMSRLPGARGL